LRLACRKRKIPWSETVSGKRRVLKIEELVAKLDEIAPEGPS
jgi:hypothetical protein